MEVHVRNLLRAPRDWAKTLGYFSRIAYDAIIFSPRGRGFSHLFVTSHQPFGFHWVWSALFKIFITSYCHHWTFWKCRMSDHGVSNVINSLHKILSLSTSKFVLTEFRFRCLFLFRHDVVLSQPKTYPKSF